MGGNSWSQALQPPYGDSPARAEKGPHCCSESSLLTPGYPGSPLPSLGARDLSWVPMTSLPTPPPNPPDLHKTPRRALWRGSRGRGRWSGVPRAGHGSQDRCVGQGVQLEWPELSGQHGLPPHLSTSHCGPGSPGTGGDTGLSHFGEQGGD